MGNEQSVDFVQPVNIAAYVRVSTDEQNEQRQMRAMREKYSEEENQIDWYCDFGENGASTSRREYQRLRKHVDEYDVVVAHELDRLGRSFADLAGFVEDLREKGVDIDLVNRPSGRSARMTGWRNDAQHDDGVR